jgi:hypothetical protein
LTIGPDGPILLHDHYLIEQLAQFNRERVPERQPHAKGSGTFGRFEVTHDVSASVAYRRRRGACTRDVAPSAAARDSYFEQVPTDLRAHGH